AVCCIAHCRLYMRLAAVSARVQPARFPCASSRLARAMVAANVACARSSARFTESGVGWRSSCAPIDCGAIGPASGLPADWRTACSKRAIAAVHGPACADAMPIIRALLTIELAANRRLILGGRVRLFGGCRLERLPCLLLGYCPSRCLIISWIFFFTASRFKETGAFIGGLMAGLKRNFSSNSFTHAER